MSLGVAASIVVGVALLVAGGAKVAAGRSWPQQAAALGAPPVAVRVVPWLEIVIGSLLCAQLARPYTAVAAALMLVSFTVLLTRRLAEGAHPPCACFGSWSATPLGWRHVVRNTVLIGVALVAASA